jgi:L-ascorbate 6-phosphate lactonase
MSLMKRIREFPVPKNSVALWWLGQSGYIFKSPEGTLAGVDLYLTDSCAALYQELNLKRLVPVLIAPGELEIDLFLCTHSHQDHADPETIRGLCHKDTMQFIGPHPSCEIFRAEGIETGRIVPSWPDCQLEFRDLQLRGAFALPTDATDLNHMGFLLQFGNGPKIYLTGDTDYSELLASAARHSPELMITVINGGFNNLSHWEAAALARQVRPRAAIPSHYDMFPDNSANPKLFEAALRVNAPEVRYLELVHGEPLVFERG